MLISNAVVTCGTNDSIVDGGVDGAHFNQPSNVHTLALKVQYRVGECKLGHV